MKNLLSAFILIGIIMTGSALADAGKKYGKELTMKKETKIRDILKRPDSFEGKMVLVKGKITGVCDKQGCWIDIVGNMKDSKIRGKVNDGEIVFPLEAIGKTAKIEGEFQKIVLSREQLLAQMKHESEMYGTDFEPESVKKGVTFFQIKIIGAVIN